MFPSRLAIKTIAKQMLAPHWPQAIVIVFLLFGTIFLPSLIIQLLDHITNSALSTVWTILSEFYALFILWPLFFGALRWFWNITAGERTPLIIIFHPFSSSLEYGRTLRVGWAFYWRLQLANIPIYLAQILKLIKLPPLPMGIDTTIFTNTAIEVAQFVSLAITVFVLIRLVSLPFSVINHPCRFIRDNVKESQIIFKDTGFYHLTFFLSLAGWFILSLLFIPLFYTLPYFLACWAVLVRFSINFYIYK